MARWDAPFRRGDRDCWFTLQDPLAAGSGAATRDRGWRGAEAGESMGALAQLEHLAILLTAYYSLRATY